MRYGAKKDANHVEIVDAMRKCGATVYDLSTTGGGVPDVIAWVKDQWRLVEIKNPKTTYGRKGLNKVQVKWLAQWRGGPVYVVRDVTSAIRFASGSFDGIEIITPDTAAVMKVKTDQEYQKKVMQSRKR